MDLTPKLREHTEDVLIGFIRSKVEEARVKGVVLGLSGGVDSATVAKLCALALGPKKVFCLMLPERGDDNETKDALEFAKALKVNYKIINIRPIVDSISTIVGIANRAVPKSKIQNPNSEPRETGNGERGTGSGDDEMRDMPRSFGALRPEKRSSREQARPLGAHDSSTDVFGTRREMREDGGPSPESRVQSPESGLSTLDSRPSTESSESRTPNPESRINRVALGNIKARVRMILLYAFANKNDYLVMGTSNKSELLTGYFTKFGDGGADFAPLGDLYKTQVCALAEKLGVPRNIIRKVPTAGLWPGQTDEGELGISYCELDKILYGIELGYSDETISETTGIASSEIERIRGLIDSSVHKRKLALIPKLGVRTVGIDWRE